MFFVVTMPARELAPNTRFTFFGFLRLIFIFVFLRLALSAHR